MNPECRFWTPTQRVVFDEPGADALGCNIRESMVGYIYIVDTPYFAKTRKSASARRVGLPAIEYQIRVWHPTLKYATGVLPHKLAQEQARRAAVGMRRSPPSRVSPAGK